MQEKETLQEQIEIARKRLDEAYAFGNDITFKSMQPNVRLSDACGLLSPSINT